MKAAIDTNRLMDFFRGDQTARQLVNACRPLYVPFIVLAEMRCGMLGGSQSLQNQGLLSEWLASPVVNILLPEEDTTHHYARLLHSAAPAGTPDPYE